MPNNKPNKPRTPTTAVVIIVVAVIIFHVGVFYYLHVKNRGMDAILKKPAATSQPAAKAGKDAYNVRIRRRFTGRFPNDRSPDAPQLVLGSYGNDPYIMKLRKKFIPEEIVNRKGPPDLTAEMAVLKQKLKQNPNDPALLYLAGWNCLMREDYGSFHDYTNQLLQQDPEEPRANELKANGFYCMGEYTKAIRHAKLAVKKAPNAAFSYYILGSSLLLGDNDAKGAIPHLKRAVKLNPDLPFAYGSLGQCYFEMGGDANIEKGVEVFTKGINRFPDHQLTFVLMAEDYLYNTGDVNRTIELTNQIIRLNPRNFQAYLMEGALLMDMGRYEKAEKAFLAGVAARPEYKFQAEIQVMLGDVKYFQGDKKNAQQYYQNAVVIQKRNPEENMYRSDAYVGLARIATDGNEIKKAEDYLDKARKAYPNNLNYVIARVDLLLVKGRPDLAVRFLENAAKNDDDNLFLQDVLVQYLKGKIHAAEGDTKAARESIIRAMKAAPLYVKRILIRRAKTDRHLAKVMRDGEFKRRYTPVLNKRTAVNRRLIRDEAD